MTTENGRVRSTFLGIEDHGLLTFLLHIEFHGAAQSFGGYRLDGNGGFDFASAAIRRLLETLRIDSWEKLPGSFVRVRRDHARDRIVAIGHIVEDSWLNLDDLVDECRAKATKPGGAG